MGENSAAFPFDTLRVRMTRCGLGCEQRVLRCAQDDKIFGIRAQKDGDTTLVA
jgi:hypothetical protein